MCIRDRSRANLNNSTFIFLNNTSVVNDCIIQPYNLRNSTLEPQKLVREISLPKNDGVVYETEPGTTGILINGVEVLNYKSTDHITYGKIDYIDVVDGGNNYDIINPPLLTITDEVGLGATGFPAVSGSLVKIELKDAGFDYTAPPIVTITGGAGDGANASVNMKQISHQVSFNAGVPFAGAATTLSLIHI